MKNEINKDEEIKALKESFIIEKRSLKFRITELSEKNHELKTLIENLEFCLTTSIKNLTEKFEQDLGEELKQHQEFYNY